MELKEVTELLEERSKNPWRLIRILCVMVIVSVATVFATGFLEEFGRDMYQGLRHSEQPAAGGQGSQSYALTGRPGAKIDINLGKEYALVNRTAGVRTLNLNDDFKNDPNLKTTIHLDDTFCYLGEVRGPLTGPDGADLEIQRDDASKELVYMLYLYGGPNSQGVVRVSCVRLLGEPARSTPRSLWRRIFGDGSDADGHNPNPASK